MQRSTMMMITIDLLDAILSPNDDRRRQAESFLGSLSVADRCTALSQALTNAPPQYQHLVAVLLRQSILKLTEPALLQSLLTTTTLVGAFFTVTTCRTAVGDCIAEACAVLELLLTASDQQQQRHLSVQTVLSAIETSSMQGDLPSLQLLVRLADRAPEAFCACVLPSLSSLVSCALKHNPNAVEVLTELVVTAALASTMNSSSSSSPSLLGTSTALMLSQQQQEDRTVDSTSIAAHLGTTCLGPLLPLISQHPSALVSLLTAADHVPSLLAGQPKVLEWTIQACLTVLQSATNDNEDQQQQLLAVQVLSSLLSVGVIRRQMLTADMRAAILQPTLHFCLGIMANDDDNDEGYYQEPASLYDSGDDSDSAFAQELLESLLHSCPLVEDLVLPRVEQLLVATPNQQRAGLAALRSCLAAAPVRMAPHLQVAMQAALGLAFVPNVCVQFEAIQLLGALCETGRIDDCQVGERVLSTLAQACQSPCSKVAAMACLAIVSFCRPPEKSIDSEKLVVPYLSNVLAALVNGPLSSKSNDSGAVVVKIRAIGAVACLAEAAGDAFVGFYSSVMPGLLACADTIASTHELSSLKGAAVEAATIVGCSIGEDNQELFVPDAERIMQMAVSILSQLSADGETVVAGMPLDLLLSACARIASVMKEAYVPYVNVVLPHLLRRVNDASDVEVTEGTEAGLDSTKRQEFELDEDTGTESMTIALPGRGLTKVTINTSKIQEKSVAARAIYEHAVALGAEFGPYCQTCLDVFLRLVHFKYSSELRATAAQTLAAVFESACAYGESFGMDLSSQYLPLVSKALGKQVLEEDVADIENVYALSEALSEVFYSVYVRKDDFGEQILSRYSNDDTSVVVKCCMKALVDCLTRRNKITSILDGHEGALSGEDEKEQYVAVLQGENSILTPLVDSVGYNLKLFRQDFLPLFDSDIASVLGPYLQAGGDMRARLSAVCLFDDCVEFCGAAAAAKYSPILLQGALAGLNDSTNGGDLDLKRASIYGIAQIARYAPSKVLIPHSQSIVPQLLSIVEGPKPDEADEGIAVFENAVSTLASLILFGSAPCNGVLKEDTATRLLLDNLPIHQDYDEAMFCSAGLCDLVEKGRIRMDIECNALVRVIGETLSCVDEGEELVSPETKLRMANILFRMQQELPGDRMQQAFGSLSVDSQASVQKAMGEYVHHFSNVVTP